MDFWCYERTANGLKESDFLNKGAKKYLETCEPEVLDVYRARSSNYADVSLANTLKQTIRAQFEKRSIGILPEISQDYSVIWLFQHRNDTSGKFLEIYRHASQSNVRDFLLITQSPEFKSKFMFDGSTMTFESVNEDYNEFVHILEPRQKVRLFYLVLADLAFHTSSLERNGRQFLELHETDRSRQIGVTSVSG